MTTHAELAKGKAQDIAANANYLADLVHDREVRMTNAADAGAAFAAEVARFLDDPDAVGTDALHKAYSTFMGRHSGNFTDSVMQYGDDRGPLVAGGVPDRMPR